MRRKRLAQSLVMIEAVVGALVIGGPAAALAGPSEEGHPPDAPSPTQGPSESGEAPSTTTTPSVSSSGSAGHAAPTGDGSTPPPRLGNVPELRPRPASGPGRSGVARTAARNGAGSPASRQSGARSTAPTAASGPRGSAPGAATTSSGNVLRIAPDPRASSPGRHAAARRHATEERRLRETVEGLSGCLSLLPQFQATVLRLRTGLGSGKPLSPSQVAGRLGVSRGGVHGAERQGLQGLRQANRRTGCGSASAAGSLAFGFRAARTTGFALSGAGGPADLSSRGFQPAAGDAGERAASPEGAKDADAQPDLRELSRAVEGAGGAAVASAGPESALRWVLILFGLACLVLLVVILARRRPARPTGVAKRAGGARRAVSTELNCSYCQSRRIAVNPSQGVYRCAHCGFRGTLPPAFLPEAANMQSDGEAQGAGEAGRRST